MNHRLAHFDTGRKPIVEQAAGFGFDHTSQFWRRLELFLGCLNGGSQLPFKLARDLDQFSLAGILDQQRCRAKDFSAQGTIGQEGLSVSGEDGGACLAGA